MKFFPNGLAAALCLFPALIVSTMVPAQPPPSVFDLADRAARQAESQLRQATEQAGRHQRRMFDNDPGGSVAKHVRLAHWLSHYTLPVPPVLHPAHPTLADGVGLIVLSGVSEVDGAKQLQRGDILLRCNGRPLHHTADLITATKRSRPKDPSSFDRSQNLRLEVLRADGDLVSLTIDASATHQGRTLGVVTELPRIGFPGIFNNPQRSQAFAGSGESLSVSNVNGDITVRGTIVVDGQPQKVDLRGTAADIDRQLAAMDPAFAAAIRDRVSY